MAQERDSLVAVLLGSLFMLSDPLVEYTEDRLAIIQKNLPTLTTVAGETGPLESDLSGVHLDQTAWL